jgi:uncharacterized protein (TIGR00730 family)
MSENDGEMEIVGGDKTTPERIGGLFEVYSDNPNVYYARKALNTLLSMLENGMDQTDWRIAGTSLKELEKSFRVFAQYRHRHKVTVFGSARTAENSETFQAAKAFGKRIAELGFMVLTGAGGGVMRAANQGAGIENSFGLNIDLPFEQAPNEVVAGSDRLINFKYFFMRKLTFIRESDALALFPGGFGTMDEAFELLTLIQCGRTPVRPVVMVDVSELNYWTKWLRFMQTSQLRNGFIDRDNLYLWTITYDIEEACRIITGFYRNFHSQVNLGDRIVLRIKKRLNEREMAELNREFADMVPEGRIEQCDILPEEEEAVKTDLTGMVSPELNRLVFAHDRRSFGRLRQLIDRINTF